MINQSGSFNGDDKNMIKSNINKNPYDHLNIEGLRQAEMIIEKTANWFAAQVEKFEEEAKILDSPDCDYETADKIRSRAAWFDKRREFELDQLSKYNEAKNRILLSYLQSGIASIK